MTATDVKHGEKNTGHIINDSFREIFAKENRQMLIAGIILTLFALAIVLPVLYYARYSFPTGDDIGYALSMRALLNRSDSYLGAVWRGVVVEYKEASGMFFTTFTDYLFSPVLNGGVTGVRIANVLLQSFFVFGVFFFALTFSRKILNKGYNVAMLIFCMIIYAVVNIQSNGDIYTWVTVVNMYNAQVGLILIGLSLFIICLMDNRDLLCIPACLIAFLGSGAALNIAALNCGILMIFGVYGFLILKRKWVSLGVFISALIGAIVNVAAPGNYVRHDEMQAGYNLSGTMINAVSVSVRAVFSRVFNPVFFVILLIMLLVFIHELDYSGTDYQFNHPLIGLFIVFISIVVVDFPVILGYGGSSIPERSRFIQDITLCIMILLWMLYFTGWLKKRFGEFEFRKEHLFAMCVACIIAISCTVYSSDDGMLTFGTPYMIHSILNGSFRSYASFECNMLYEIRDSVEDDVVIVRDEIPYNPYAKYFYVDEDPGQWPNTYYAKYYGKNSVRIEYPDS